MLVALVMMTEDDVSSNRSLRVATIPKGKMRTQFSLPAAADGKAVISYAHTRMDGDTSATIATGT